MRGSIIAGTFLFLFGIGLANTWCKLTENTNSKVDFKLLTKLSLLWYIECSSLWKFCFAS